MGRELPRGVAVAACCALILAVGCGDDAGVSEDATVTVYAAASLCAGAKRELSRQGGRAEHVRVRVACLASTVRDGGLSLAAIGANARRASEDSTSVGYMSAPDPAATRFSGPILESANIAQLISPSGAAAISKLLRAIRRAPDGAGLRESVYDEFR